MGGGGVGGGGVGPGVGVRGASASVSSCSQTSSKVKTTHTHNQCEVTKGKVSVHIYSIFPKIVTCHYDSKQVHLFEYVLSTSFYVSSLKLSQCGSIAEDYSDWLEAIKQAVWGQVMLHK